MQFGTDPGKRLAFVAVDAIDSASDDAGKDSWAFAVHNLSREMKEGHETCCPASTRERDWTTK